MYQEGSQLEDPYVIAERELLAVVAVVEEAGRKLAVLKPRERPKEADESLNFEEQILEAAKSITAAVAALVKAATVAQKELIAVGRRTSENSSIQSGGEDAEWSQGLIAAARLTATATESLCEAANAAVQGEPSEEKLVASAKAVAVSTGKLLLACGANADPNSKTQKGLQSAGAAVQRAARTLEDAAKGSAVFQQDDCPINEITTFNADLQEELEIQELILKKERELQKARAKLYQIRETNRKRNEEEEEEAENL